jgi:hypothetical protein
VQMKADHPGSVAGAVPARGVLSSVWCRRVTSSPCGADLGLGALQKELAAKWKAISDVDKQVYVDMAAADKAKYDAAVAEVSASSRMGAAAMGAAVSLRPHPHYSHPPLCTQRLLCVLLCVVMPAASAGLHHRRRQGRCLCRRLCVAYIRPGNDVSLGYESWHSTVSLAISLSLSLSLSPLLSDERNCHTASAFDGVASRHASRSTSAKTV